MPHSSGVLQKWRGFPKETHILNIAAEFSRCLHWLNKESAKEVKQTLHRAFDLIDLTVDDPQWRGTRLKELLRVREGLARFYLDAEKNKSAFVRLFKALLYLHPKSAAVQIG